MIELDKQQKDSTGFFSTKFYYAFRGIFLPVTRFCKWARIKPNAVTVFSIVLGILMGVFFALDRLFIGIVIGLAMAFSDIVDGQLAKITGEITPFGGILDSTIDRYNEFLIFVGLGFR